MEETLSAVDVAVASGRARYAGVSNLPGWRTAARRGLAAGLAGPGPAGRDPGRVLAAGAGRRAGGAAGLRLGRARRPRVLAAGPRGAHRQVPARRALGLPGRLAAPARLRRPPPRPSGRPDRGGRRHRGRGPGHLPAGGRAGLGPGPAGGQRADPRRPDRRASCPARWPPTRRCSRPRSGTRSTTCPRPRAATRSSSRIVRCGPRPVGSQRCGPRGGSGVSGACRRGGTGFRVPVPARLTGGSGFRCRRGSPAGPGFRVPPRLTGRSGFRVPPRLTGGSGSVRRRRKVPGWPTRCSRRSARTGCGRGSAGPWPTRCRRPGSPPPRTSPPRSWPACPGSGTIRAGRLLSAWIGAAHVYEVAQLVVPAGLRARVAARAVDAFGDDAGRRLRDDPWRLLELPDVRVVEADRVAVSALPGVRRDDPRRGRALVAYALNRAARDGHTVQPVELVLAAIDAEGVADPSAAVAAPRSRPAPCDEADGTLSLQRLAMAEVAVAEAIARLHRDGRADRGRRDGGDGARRPGRDAAQRGRGGATPRGERADRRPGHRQEPHRGRAGRASPRPGVVGRARRAHRPGGEAAGGALRRARRSTLHRLLGAQPRS